MTTTVARPSRIGERIFGWLTQGASIALVLLLAAIGAFLLQQAWPVLARGPWAFLTGSEWDPVHEHYGALPVLFGTVASSLLALALAGPIGICVALFVTELAEHRVSVVIGSLVQLLAAIPSVVYGLWGIFVLAPALRAIGSPYGVGMLAAALILAIMIVPTVVSICVEVFRAVPTQSREAALALGSTRWEAIRLGVIGSSRAGIFGALILALGRALGETMAVTMVIGNRAQISASLFEPAQTMASLIANEYAEAVGDFHLAALAAVGVALFVLTFVLNASARLLVRSTVRRNHEC